jgi:hypothetical protein
MKKLITLLLITSIGYSQDTIPKRKWLQIGLLTSSVVFNAVGDGLNSKLHYVSGHIFDGIGKFSCRTDIYTGR